MDPIFFRSQSCFALRGETLPTLSCVGSEVDGADVAVDDRPGNFREELLPNPAINFDATNFVQSENYALVRSCTFRLDDEDVVADVKQDVLF